MTKILYCTAEDFEEVAEFVDTSIMFEDLTLAKQEAEDLEEKVFKITIEEIE